MQKIRYVLLNVSVFILATLIMVFLIESASYLLYEKEPGYHYEKGCEHQEKDEYYGYVLKKNISCRSMKLFDNDTVIYDISYTTDMYGRRDTGEIYKPDENHILLFGGSVAFGEGLEDEDTLQHLLSKKTGNNVFSYTNTGYGTNHMLAKLEVGFEEDEVYSDEGVAIYIFITPHINRVVGNTQAWWMFDSPYYFLDSNKNIVRKGSFETGRPILTSIYKTAVEMKEQSYFLKLINFNLPPNIREKDIELTLDVIKRSKELYEEEFNGEFVVVMHPEWNTILDTEERHIYESAIKGLDSRNIIYFDYSDHIYDDEYTLKYDPHPNRRLNEWLSKEIAEDLQDLK